MPGKITSGVAVDDLMANLQTNRAAMVSPLSCLSDIKNETGCFTTLDNTDRSLTQTEANSSGPQPAFCHLMQSKPSALLSHQNTFRHMTLTELIDSKFQADLPPTSKEFKVILFNDALKNYQFSFDAKVIAEVRSGLLTANAPSYKYLASIAISIAQTKAALAELKQEGKLNETEFNTLNLRLKKYADLLSSVGNDYCRELAKKPGQDIFTSFLVIRSHKNGKFTRLFKQAENIDTAVKAIVSSHNETREKITRNLNDAVSQFIVHYFEPGKKENIEAFEQLNKYIKPGAYNKIQALFKDESRNRQGHQFNMGGIEHLYDCYAEIFDHFKMHNQFVHDQNAANEPTTNGKPADQESPITPEDVDDGVNGNPTPSGQVNGEPVEQKKPAIQRHSSGGINNHFSPVFNPINSPNFINDVNSDLLDKLNDNNRLLAKVLEQLTKKSSVSRGVQTDDMPSSVDAAVSPIALGIPERRLAAQFFDAEMSDKLPKKASVSHGVQVGDIPSLVDAAVSSMELDIRRSAVPFAETPQPQKTDKSTITSTNGIDNSENSGDITRVIATDEMDTVIAQSAATQLSKSKIAQALSHVTVLPRRAQMMNAFQLNEDKQGQHRIEQMNADTMRANLLKSKHHGQSGNVQNEMEKVVLKPTMTPSPRIFTVNSHYKERHYYDESGKILPGFVSDRLSAFENRSDTVTFNQKNKIENKARDVASALRDVIATAINRSNATMPAADDAVTALDNTDLPFLNQKNKIENKARDVASALRDVIATAINRSNATMPAADDAVTALDNTDLPFLNQKNKIENGAKGVASALHDLIDTATNQAKVITPVDDTVAEFGYADLTLVPAKKVVTAERVKNHMEKR